MSVEKLGCQAEVSRLLQIVANSLYSEKQVFLRELISNASDACDRLRYMAIASPELIADDPEFRVRLTLDGSARTLEIADNGIGMNREALIDDLGTIARSGTTAFVDGLSGDAKGDMELIGQFGVGFYSAFMVADRVEVLTLRAGEDQAWLWKSDGAGEFTVEEAEKDGRGSTITLHMHEDQGEFLEDQRIRHIVRTYSDHVALPIVLAVPDGDDDTLNQASALWTRPAKDITPEQYTEFYHHVGHAYDEPWLTLHWRAEGMLEYSNLIFVPSAKPFDLFHPDRKHHLKLYVKRVFIADDCEGLVPNWLRFLHGVVDSEALQLNVSREMLQNNPMVARMRGAIVKRVLSELGKKADDAAEEYAAFWENFGAVLKEGLYEDSDHRDELVKLARFKSTMSGDGLTSLAVYAGRMKDGQQAIYYITGEELDALRRSPQLEGFVARGIEVLLLTDPVDEFWIPAVNIFEEKPLKSATRAGADLSDIPLSDDADGTADDSEEDKPDAGRLDSLVAMFKLALADEVKDVRLSDRLTDSAACLVADDGDMDIHLEQLLKQHNQLDAAGVKRILEINPKHKLMRALADQLGEDGAATKFDDTAWLVLDQARILEGEKLSDPAAFSRRLADALTKGLGVG